MSQDQDIMSQDQDIKYVSIPDLRELTHLLEYFGNVKAGCISYWIMVCEEIKTLI
jgi:hypothetical protein